MAEEGTYPRRCVHRQQTHRLIKGEERGLTNFVLMEAHTSIRLGRCGAIRVHVIEAVKGNRDLPL
jgi:hypothetical protein